MEGIRIYHSIIQQHIGHNDQQNDQMLFITGPRQVGKTTCSMAAQLLTDRFCYFNWDVLEHRQSKCSAPLTLADR